MHTAELAAQSSTAVWVYLRSLAMCITVYLTENLVFWTFLVQSEDWTNVSKHDVSAKHSVSCSKVPSRTVAEERENSHLYAG